MQMEHFYIVKKNTFRLLISYELSKCLDSDPQVDKIKYLKLVCLNMPFNSHLRPQSLL